ncbi:MAG: methylenetetrahydrofolate reductase C-terminal domain-containing protein [Bacillota bacterium]
MIVGERKPVESILAMLAPHGKVLLAGCGTCVTVCLAGGEKEVGVLAAALRLARQAEGKPLEVVEATIERQCEHEFVEELAAKLAGAEAILSLGCGAGVQTIAERYADLPVYPGLNTSFIGIPVKHGDWAERCAACGDCILDSTGGICPIARCSKSLLNGPCGGSAEGKCEVSEDTDCAWQLIFDRLKAQRRLELLAEVRPPKDWSRHRDGGPRRIVREDAAL